MVFEKKLAGKNIQVVTLSMIFMIVAFTGLVPWFIDLTGSGGILRLILIEIHDKLALILVIYIVLHLIKRCRWFITTYAKLRRHY
ncbi:MAG: hypothetical protein Q8880_05485 [Bacteroidota bacterium]|nr:hypothetical protein [Bacteroidota bacterium]